MKWTCLPTMVPYRTWMYYYIYHFYSQHEFKIFRFVLAELHARNVPEKDPNVPANNTGSIGHQGIDVIT